MIDEFRDTFSLQLIDSALCYPPLNDEIRDIFPATNEFTTFSRVWLSNFAIFYRSIGKFRVFSLPEIDQIDVFWLAKMFPIFVRGQLTNIEFFFMRSIGKVNNISRYRNTKFTFFFFKSWPRKKFCLFFSDFLSDFKIVSAANWRNSWFYPATDWRNSQYFRLFLTWKKLRFLQLRLMKLEIFFMWPIDKFCGFIYHRLMVLTIFFPH